MTRPLLQLLKNLLSLPTYIIRKRALGDVLWAEPIIRKLAATHKRVIVHTLYNDLFQNYPLPNVTFKNQLSFTEKVLNRLHLPNFISLELSYERSPKMHLLHAYEHTAHLPLTEEYPVLYLSQAEKQLFAGRRPYVVFHIDSASGKNYRKVYGVDWKAVVDTVKAAGFDVLYLGRKDEHWDHIGATYISTSIREMIALLYNASFFVGADSGPSHIAASLSIPSLLFFGAVNFDYRHFRKLFRGYLMQSYCEFAGCYHDVTNTIYGSTCRLVGDEGIPKCSVHTTEDVITHIHKLISYDRQENQKPR